MNRSFAATLPLSLALTLAACSSPANMGAKAIADAGNLDSSLGPIVEAGADAGNPDSSVGPVVEAGVDAATCLTATDAAGAPQVGYVGPSTDAVTTLPPDVVTVPDAIPFPRAGAFVDTSGSVDLVADLAIPDSDGGTTYGFGIAKLAPGLQAVSTAPVSRDASFTVSSAVVDGAGDMFVTGFTTVTDAPLVEEATTSKYAPDGTLAWTAQYQLGSETEAFAIGSSPDGSVVVAGDSGSVGFLIKYSSAGAQEWVRQYCDISVVETMTVDSTGNIYVALFQESAKAVGSSVLSKFDPDGNLLYAVSFATGNETGPLALSVDQTALYVYAQTAEVTTPIALRKFDAKTGALIWSVASGQNTAPNDPDAGVTWNGKIASRISFAVTADTIYASGGYSNSYSDASVSTAFVPYVVAYDTDGNQKWFEQFAIETADGGVDSTQLDYPPRVTIDLQGDVVVLVQRMTSSIPYGTAVWKVSPAGVVQ